MQTKLSRTRTIHAAIKYAADRWSIKLSTEDIGHMADDLCEALTNADSGTVGGEMKALDCIRTQGGLMVTYEQDGRESYTTQRGTPIHGGTAKSLIERKFVVPVGTDLFGDGRPQLYEAAIR